MATLYFGNIIIIIIIIIIKAATHINTREIHSLP